MVEVVLGLGLIAFGLLTTVQLLPAGLSANRDANAEVYAADSADQFLHFYAVRLKSSTDNYENWDQFVQRMRYSSGYGEEPTYWTEWFTEPTRPAEFSPPPTSPSEEDPWKDWTTKFMRSDSDPGYFKVEQKAGGAEGLDFSAVYKVTYHHYVPQTDGQKLWAETPYWRNGAAYSNPPPVTGQTADIIGFDSAYNNAISAAGEGGTPREVIEALQTKVAGLDSESEEYEDCSEALETFKSYYLAPVDIRIEISWPANLPYKQRRKALYNLEVYRPE